MRLQHEEIVSTSTAVQKPYGVIAVAAGDGMAQLFKSLGADQVISGGQSMNPSAEQFLTACDRLQAETIFILPNNSNVIMAARQAAEMSTRKVIVLPSKSMQQGVAALVAFQAEQSAEHNEQNMLATFDQVQSGALTIAVRDTDLDGLTIKTNDFIGLHNNRLVVAHEDAHQAALALVEKMISDEHFMLTVYSGEDASPQFVQTLLDTLTQTYGDLEIEHYLGGQPVYQLLLAAE